MTDLLETPWLQIEFWTPLVLKIDRSALFLSVEVFLIYYSM